MNILFIKLIKKHTEIYLKVESFSYIRTVFSLVLHEYL